MMSCVLVFRIPQGPKSSSTSTTPIRKSVSVASELEMEPMLPLDPVTDAYLKSKGHHDNLIHLLESSTEGYGLEKTDKVSVCLLSACCLLVVCLLSACCLLVVCLLSACCLLVVCLLSACCLLVVCLLVL